MRVSEIEHKLSWLPLSIIAILIGFFLSGCMNLREERARERAFENAKIEREVTEFYNVRETIRTQTDYERLERYVARVAGTYEAPFLFRFRSNYSEWTHQEEVTLNGTLRVEIRRTPESARLQFDSPQPANLYQELADALRLDVEIIETIGTFSERRCSQSSVVPPYQDGVLILTCIDSGRTYRLELSGLEGGSLGFLSRRTHHTLNSGDLNRTLFNVSAHEATQAAEWTARFEMGAPGQKRVLSTVLERARLSREGDTE